MASYAKTGMTISENFDMERVVNDAMQGMLNDFRRSGINVVIKSETDIIKDEFSGLIWSYKNMVFEANNTDIYVDYWTNITSDGPEILFIKVRHG